MNIQWFPGHMAKARREIEEKLNLVDLVVELVDARAPVSSQNPMLQEIIANKQKLIIMMKKDLADIESTNQWLQYCKDQGIDAIAINANDHQDIQLAINVVNRFGQQNVKKLIDRGVQSRPVRAMVIGIPNVGKSTL